jgi:hypothetical protein
MAKEVRYYTAGAAIKAVLLQVDLYSLEQCNPNEVGDYLQFEYDDYGKCYTVTEQIEGMAFATSHAYGPEFDRKFVVRSIVGALMAEYMGIYN